MSLKRAADGVSAVALPGWTWTYEGSSKGRLGRVDVDGFSYRYQGAYMMVYDKVGF